MSQLRQALIPIGGLALLLPVAFFWRGRSELQSARLELVSVNRANEVLKRTLADMIVAISAKDKEIDRLRLSPCDGGGKVASAPIRPAHDRISGPGSIRGGVGRPNASAEGATR
jgi:hypothetical protein